MASSEHPLLESRTSIMNASLDDFEGRDFSPTMPDLPSQHSGFRSNIASEYSEETSSRRSYSPPAWRKAGAGWFQNNQPSLSPSRRPGFASRESSPRYHSVDEEGDEEDVTAYRTAMRIPLPASPEKGRSPSVSPEAADDVVAPDVEDDDGGNEEQVEDDDDTFSPEPEKPIEQGNCQSLYVKAGLSDLIALPHSISLSLTLSQTSDSAAPLLYNNGQTPLIL